MVPLSTLLDDDSKRNGSKPGNNMKHQRPPSTTSSNHTDSKKKSTTPPWNIKLRSRLCTIVFGQPTLHFKVGQRVQISNRPVFTVGTISYVGKLTSSPDNSKNTISSNHDLFLGVELDRSGKNNIFYLVNRELISFFFTSIVGTSDGSIDGKRYFTTLPNKGIFVKPSDVTFA